MKKIALKTYYAIVIAIVLWLIFSWVEVVTHNTSPNPTYSSINLIQLFTMLF